MNRTTVEEIKARLSIEDVIGSYIKLEKSGKSFRARCPFHNEKTPSFFVSPDRGGYYCFGCNAKGDIFSFVEQFEGLDFRGALKVLAEKAGVPLVYDQKASGEKDELYEIMENVAKFFEANLESNKEAQNYLNKRGISPETRKAFRLGWAPEGWQNTHDYFKKKGFNDAKLEKAGLIKKREEADQDASHNPTANAPAAKAAHATTHSTGYYDRFRGRVMFPIMDSSGRVIAFTGRILKDDGQSAKYLNSPETPIFNKSEILFGLDKAKTEIRRMNYSILVEGQMDLVLSHQVGVKNVVAASGTALSDQSKSPEGITNNIGMVRRLSSNMIIALDSDQAGRTAAMKAVAATALGLGMSVKIAEIEGGKDPADLILANPENWKLALKNAKHVIEFELDNVMRDNSDPHKVAAALRTRVFPFLSKIDSSMDKSFYVKVISEKAHISETSVWEDLKKYEAANPFKPKSERSASLGALRPTQTMSTAANRLDLVERRLFGLLFLMENANDPQAIAQAATYRDQIAKIAGESYAERNKKAEAMKSDLLFEAESYYGSVPEERVVHIKELIFNFEEYLINEDLVKTMQDLRDAEKKGERELMGELAKKCQVLSVRKGEIGKMRRG